MGMGSSLDSSRFRFLLAKELGVNQGNVDALVMGEHGPTMVPIFSHVKSMGKKIHFQEKKSDKITTLVRNYWKDLILFKGASVFGAAKNSFDLVKAIVEKNDLQTTVSTVLDGEYGFSNISMGVPSVVGKNGIKEITRLKLNSREIMLLNHSGKRISDGIDMLTNLLK